ncbi:caspase-8-like [Rhinichthys klamathensis goyatoka]|uniref:caspase-8-like n=1 Tax=Rhinichthys klamathensis goyatoka TaxID=3034132 RepID=UPI0024B61E0F|nr:caspase-8-like [Rhinichthys klamathensis goyatoka]
MDLQKFHKIDENLPSTDVAKLKFLCINLIPTKRLETVKDAKDLFLRLGEQALLDDELLVPELLITIGRLDLLAILNTSKEEVDRKLPERESSSKGVSPYRKMLFEIFEDMTEENLRSVKFLLELPKAKLGPSASLLDIMIEMEKQQKLGEDNLDELHSILEQCDKPLACRIEEFQNMGRDPEQDAHRLPLNVDIENIERKEGRRRGSSFGSVGSVYTDSDPPPTSDEYYIMTQRPLGYCLIINNYNFEKKSKFSNREGTWKDKDDLFSLFHRMHFKVEVRDDLEASDIRDAIKEFANKDHAQMGAFVCCVLSHGEKGTVLGVDGKPVEIRELTQPFAECRTLASKPKLFFIQACQGKVAQDGVWTADGQVNNTEEGTFEEDAYNPALRMVPIEADFLIGMATVEYYQSFRHTRKGSIYIQELSNLALFLELTMDETCHVSNNDQKSQATKKEQNKGKASDKSQRKKAVRRKSQEAKENQCVQKTILLKRKREPLQPTGNISDHYPKKKHAVTKHNEFYSMSNKPCGYCLIINNYNFEGPSLTNREGTDKDKDNLTRVFENMFFEVEVRADLRASDMQNVIKEFAERDHSRMDAFVCCILSHGEKGSVLGIDGKEVPIRELTQPFAECRTLVSKPKLFFIQACQGNEAQQGVWMPDGQESTTEDETFEEDAYVPLKADFLIGMATVEQYQSFRNTKDGSIYIQELCKQLEIGCPRKEDMHSILTRVNREVSLKNIQRSKQMPEVRYTLTKILVLPMKQTSF